MSEPRQLYARVHLSRQRLDESLASPFPDVSADEDVLKWLAAASYYGERYTPQLIRERVCDHATVGEWVQWLAEPAPYGFEMPHRNYYDDATHAWTLAALDFSENYDDFLAAVAVYRAVARVKDFPGEDCLLVYSFLFGDSSPSIALQIEMGGSRFLSESEAAPLVAQADTTMEELMAEGASKAGAAEA
jgi:hypothetical protein